MNHTESLIKAMERQLDNLEDFQTKNKDVEALVMRECSELKKRIAYLKG